MNAYRDGSFSGSNEIAILNQGGEELLRIEAGPLFFANLSPGTYTIISSHQGKEKRQKLQLGQAPRHLHFAWQPTSDDVASGPIAPGTHVSSRARMEEQAILEPHRY
jgi:hypothetical protein